MHEDHVRLVEHVRAGNVRAATARMRIHLARLDSLIDAVHARHAGYFVD